MVVATLTGHAPVRKHLHTMGLLEGDPTCRICGLEVETVQHITCYCEALARKRYNVFGSLAVEPTEYFGQTFASGNVRHHSLTDAQSQVLKHG
jgi:hypothetical protein